MKTLSLILALLLSVPCFAANTYYVSKSSGLDTRTSTQAKVNTTPWAHLPGMNSATSNAAAYTPISGDTFILMGCDVWVSTDLPVTWDWSGTTITVDNTWYNTTNCPSGWNRPVFDAGGNSIADFGWMMEIARNSGTTGDVVNNIEFKGFATTDGRMVGCYNTCSTFTFSNNYFHAWHFTTDNQCEVFQLGASTVGGTITQNVIDGSDRVGTSGSQGTCGGIFLTLPHNFTNNVIHDIPNSIVGYTNNDSIAVISGNLLYNSLESAGGVNHANTMETLGGGTYYIHDNVIHHDLQNGGEVMMIGNSGETDYIWNNVMYDLGAGQPPNFPQTSGQGAIPGPHFWNNTIVALTQPCFFFSGQSGATFGTVDIKNNHCIAGSLYGAGATVTTLITTPNVLMSPATAASQGYTSSQTFAYSPTLISNGTVGGGTNLTSSCSGSNAGLCSDTAYACSQQTIAGVVQSVCPARTANTRPSSGAWDAGAYQFSGSTPTASTPTFSPVAGIYVGTQSVAISTSSGGAIICYTITGTTPATNGSTGCTTGTLYSTAVSVPVSETLKAVAGGTGFIDSSVGSAAYVINARSAGALQNGTILLNGAMIQ